MEFLDRNGQPLRSLLGEDGQFTRPAAFSEIPLRLVQATVAAEDQRFWTHPGVDVRAIVRATWSLVRHGRIVSGASTITQQLIKQAQPRPRTLRTKLIEAVQALRLEQVWDKQRILAEYLNRVDYGNLNTGCATAARFYFDKPLRELSPAECALLAGLPQAPSRLNPLKHPERSQRRRQWILRRMRELGFLTEAEYARAGSEPLRLARDGRAFEAPHFIDLLLDQLNDGNLSRVPESRADNLPPVPHSLTSPFHRHIRTSLDLDLNRFVARVLREQLADLDSQNVRNGAVVIIDNRTGEVLSLVGSEDYFAPDVGQVNGAWARRSPGSALKPFTYAIAFEHGATPATVLADVPSVFATPTGEFAPVNFDRVFRGPVRARVALACSLNVPAVRLLDRLGGPAPLYERLQSCGLTTLDEPPDHYGLGLTIGNAEVRLLELANAYACLARLGEYRPFTLLKSDSIKAVGRRVFDARAAWLIADILSDNGARTAAFGLDSSLRFDFPVACKTGTSSDFRDNWAFGYTPEFTVGVWVGNFDGTPMQHLSGVAGAGPVLHALFIHLHDRFGTAWFERPAGIVERAVDALTGNIVSEGVDPFSNVHGDQRAAQTEMGLQPVSLSNEIDDGGRSLAAGPRVTESLHGQLVAHRNHERGNDGFQSVPLIPAGDGDAVEWIPTESKGRFAGSAPGNVIEKFLVEALPPTEAANAFDERGRVKLGIEYREWFAASAGPRRNEFVLREEAALPLRIVSPLPGTTFFLDPDLPESGGRVFLKAVGGAGLHWGCRSLPVDSDRGRPFIVLAAGRHQLVVRDERTGRTAATWIVVKRL